MTSFSLDVPNDVDCSKGCIVLEKMGTFSLAPSSEKDDFHQDAAILLCCFLVISMQLGFAMLEVGSCRQVHRTTVLTKNVLDSAISMVVFCISCELSGSDLVRDTQGRIQNHLLIYHSAFCATSVTVCSGSMAERTHMVAYICYAVLMSAVIYPQIARGAWAHDGILGAEFNGKLNRYAYHDFAGSGVVHLAGGCAALVGNILLGRRVMTRDPSCPDSPIKQFWHQETSPPRQPPQDPDDGSTYWTQDKVCPEARGQTRKRELLRRFDDPERDSSEFKGSDYLQALGMFQLWVGWYGFMAGSALLSDGTASSTVSLVALNTSIAAAAGGVGSFIFSYFTERELNLRILCNGVLCGLVGITASCSVATVNASMIIGLASSVVIYPLATKTMRRLRLDDPVDAVPVHAACGLFGVLAVAFCRPDCDKLKLWKIASVEHIRFCAADHEVSQQFLAQVWGAFTLIWWTTSISLLLWGAFALFECAAAVEEDAMEEVLNVCYELALSDKPSSAYKELFASIKQSAVAVDVFKEHGWIEDGEAKEKYANSGHMLEMCRYLQEAKECRVESALEIKQWRLIRWLAQILHRTLAHKLTCVRLRVAPVAELAGLGSSDLERRGLLRNAKHLIASMEHETSSMQKASTATLQRDVRELNKMILSQDALLTALAYQRRYGSSSNASSSLPSPPSYGSQHHLVSGGSTPTQGSGCSLQKGSGGSDSTLPDRQPGHLVASTIGRQERHGKPKRLPFGSSGTDGTLHLVAKKLQEVVETQQCLMTALGPPPTAAFDRKPATPGNDDNV
mmetsp:Transcript_15681/g.25471  ORF Transcript_15681/g.25471 Transcript_15681/m.25471 type:complete len:794 (-) Transcript_15681:39-2420(-)